MHGRPAHRCGTPRTARRARRPAAAPRRHRRPARARTVRAAGAPASSSRVYGFCGAVEDVEDRRLLDDCAVLQHRHVVGDLADDAEVVADPDHRGAEVALQLADQIDDLRLRRDVQRGGRLVGDQQFGVAGQRDRDHHALTLTARELVRVGVQAGLRIGQADRLEQLERPGACLPPRHLPMRLKGFGDLPLQGQQRVERGPRVLEHEADPAAVHAAQQPAARRRRAAVRPSARQRAGARDHGARRVQQSGRGEHGHRLAGSGLADDAQRLLTLRRRTTRRGRCRAGRCARRGRARDSTGSVTACLRASIMVRCLGSSTSRSPSPTRLKASTMTKIAAPGNTAIHHASVTNPWESKIIRPSDGCGGWMPSPRNDSAASDRIANASDSDVCTISGPAMFGRMWRRKDIEVPGAHRAGHLHERFDAHAQACWRGPPARRSACRRCRSPESSSSRPGRGSRRPPARAAAPGTRTSRRRRA